VFQVERFPNDGAALASLQACEQLLYRTLKEHGTVRDPSYSHMLDEEGFGRSKIWHQDTALERFTCCIEVEFQDIRTITSRKLSMEEVVMGILKSILPSRPRFCVLQTRGYCHTTHCTYY